MSLNFIETFSGISFQPLSPVVGDIRIQDIAHGLSLECRFSGQCREFYSVAQHSVSVSWLLEDWEEPTDVQLWGLMHDATEGLGLRDLALPLKRSHLLAGYLEAEKHLMEKICERFGMQKKQPPAVFKADATLLATEARDLMPYRPEHWGALTEAPLEGVIVPWTSAEAERKFMRRFVELRARTR